MLLLETELGVQLKIADILMIAHCMLKKELKDLV